MEKAVNPPSISAEELHEILINANTLGNRARKEFITALHAMHVSQLYLMLGFSSIYQYAENCFQCKRSRTYEYLGVAEALPDLPLSDAAFVDGKLSWSLLRELVKVASGETEAEWLGFINSHSPGRAVAEMKDAKKKNRKRPRKDSHSLPNLTVKVTFTLNAEEHDIVKKALQKTAEEMGESLQGERVHPKDVFLYIARQILSTDPVDARKVRDDSLYTILYHRCTDCRATHLPTAEGPVEIPEETVDRVEGEARTVDITEEVPVSEQDKPNTAATTRKIRLRDGRVCANPSCGRKLGVHAHHIKFRSQGGKTLLNNETLVCTVCHALIHQGLLTVEGTPATGLHWKPKIAKPVIDLDKELRKTASVPEIHVVEKSTAVDSEKAQSATVDSEKTHQESPQRWTQNDKIVINEALVYGLINLGYRKKEARERITYATRTLSNGSGTPKEEDILRLALQR